MSDRGLSSGETFLTNAAREYFAAAYQSSSFSFGTQIDASLSWIPTFNLKVLDHQMILGEVSDNPYPIIFSLRRLDIMNLQNPISIYCVCTEEAYIREQQDAKRLMNDGYGLLTVAADASVQRRSGCIPLIQQISKAEFLHDIKGFPPSLKTRLAEAFDSYNHNASNGVSIVAEVMEGLIFRAGKDAVKKGWLPTSSVKAGLSAATLAAMQAIPQFTSSTAAIGAAQAFISMHRNTSQHFPKDKKQAAAKYRDCRHAFLEGVKKMHFFRTSMRHLQLTGGV